jgi:cation-transporting P-type ATPase C
MIAIIKSKRIDIYTKGESSMVGEIAVKSVANNRIRLKSRVFAAQINTDLVQSNLRKYLIDFRVNNRCNSIIITHKKSYATQEIIEKVYALFGIERIKTPFLNASTKGMCSVSASCVGCAKAKDAKSFKRSLVEFGVLSIFAGYILVKEHILGIAVSASPFSLVAAVAIFAATPLLYEASKDIKQKKLTLHSFMGLTLVAAVFAGEAVTAFEIIYILRGGMILEEYIASKSKKEIQSLVELDIKKVYILKDDIELEIPIETLSKGDIVVSRSGEKIPVDGTVLNGSAEVDEAVINGRSEPVFKQIGDTVFAGCVCEKGRIAIEVQGIANQTYIARTMHAIEQSLAQKSPAEVAADKLAARLLKLGTVLTVGTFVFTGSIVNAFAVMIVMSCPCATVLAASTAISGGIAKGAKNGVLIKGGAALESVAAAEVFCFDKTGTLTDGKPAVTDIFCFEGVDEETLLQYVATAEQRNSHPIAKSIVAYAKAKNIDLNRCALSAVIPGEGVEAVIEDDTYRIGNIKLLAAHNIAYQKHEKRFNALLDEGKTAVFIARNDTVIGMLAFAHQARQDTHRMIKALRTGGVKHIVLLTGDETKVAHGFAKSFDFDAVYANQSPQEKAAVIETLKHEYGKTVMVGDGVNDTYAMSKADVAVSFAAGGSEAAIALSDIAITHSHPQDVVFLYELSKKTLQTVEQNYYIATGTNVAGVVLAALGKLSPVAAGAVHIGHTVGIMANSSKLAYS